MKGKEKCKALKEIRRQIAEKNDIPFVVSQCNHKGDCRGTCPKCESELRYLEKELALRQGLGKAVAIAGISVGVCAGLSACAPTTDYPPDSAGHIETAVSQLAGDLPMPETTEAPDGAGCTVTESVPETMESTPETIEIPDEVEGLMVEPTDTEPEDETDWILSGDIEIAE